MAKTQRCEIEFTKDGTSNAYSFKAEIPETVLCDMLMNEFAPLGLATHEKRELSLKDRQNLCRFRNLDDDNIRHHADQFLKKLSKMRPGTQVTVNAKDVAAYVCLAAIYSGDVPEHIELNFELSEVPVKLFPENLVCAEMPDNVALSFCEPKDTWLERFQSICEVPAHIAPRKNSRQRAAA